jgi:hypothetical protein
MQPDDMPEDQWDYIDNPVFSELVNKFFDGKVPSTKKDKETLKFLFLTSMSNTDESTYFYD